MDKTILLCLADGSEETEAVATFDLLVRASFQVRAASVNGDGGLNHRRIARRAYAGGRAL